MNTWRATNVLLTLRLSRGCPLHAIHHPLLVLADERRQFGFLLRSHDLYHLLPNAGVLHSELGQDRSLLRGQLAGFSFIEASTHD